MIRINLLRALRICLLGVLPFGWATAGVAPDAVDRFLGTLPAASGSASYSRDGDAYRIVNAAGLELKGRVGGGAVFSRVTLGRQPIGAFNASIHYNDGAARRWIHAGEVLSADWDEQAGCLTVRVAGKDAEHSFELEERITPLPDRAAFRADVVRVRNTGEKPMAVQRVYFRTDARFANEGPAPEKPFILRDGPTGLCRGSWRAKDGREWGAVTDSPHPSVWHCWFINEKHPTSDHALVLGLKGPLAPGEAFEVPPERRIRAWMFAKQGEGVPQETRPDFHDVPGHPRLFFTQGRLADLRDRCEDGDLVWRYRAWLREVYAACGAELPPEPAWLPKEHRSREYARIFRTIRPPTHMMQTAALVFALGGDAQAGAEAKRRVLYYFGFDPNGPTCTTHNDEPAMSILRNGCRAYDWTYGLYTPEERERIEQCILVRAKAVYDVLKKRRFHENPRNSHLGRQIGFLAEACLVVMPEHPEAKEWYDYVMNVYRTVYPAWGGDDGGWNEGPHYWCAYMDFGLDSLTAVLNATGENVFATKPFFRETPWYAIYQVPPGSPMSPFGDGWQAGPQRPTVIRSFAVLQNSPELLYFAGLYGRAEPGYVRDLVLDPKAIGLKPRAPRDLPCTRCFPGEGLVMSHSAITNAAENVSFFFRSTPFGSVSHGHEDQNAFCVSAYGEPLAIATGYYNYYGSPHHYGWTRATKAKCAITYDGGKGQRRGADFRGRIAHFEADGITARFAGDATAAYGGELSRAVREVVRVDAETFVIRDAVSSEQEHVYEFNLHAVDEMLLDEAAQKVQIVRPRAVLEARFLAAAPLRFAQTSAFEPPLDEKVLRQGFTYPDQWHFRASAAKAKALDLVTVLEVRRSGEKAKLVSVERKGDAVELRFADGRRHVIQLSSCAVAR